MSEVQRQRTQKMCKFFKVVLIHLIGFALNQNLHAGAWTLERGQLWVKSSVSYQKTSERYYSRNTPCPFNVDCVRTGQRVDFPFDGQSRFTAVYLDFKYGLLDQLELQFQIPFFDIEFTDFANPERPSTTDIGDIRFGARYRLLANPIVSTIKVEAKAPTGFFNKDAEVVPIGDGQWDVVLIGQFGKSLWPIQGYINFDVGYRARFAPDIDTSSLEPGDEFFFRGEAGYNFLTNLLLKVALSGLYGEEFSQGNSTIFDSEREVLFIEPGIYWVIAQPLALESSVQISLSGKNYPAGEVFNFGVSYTFSVSN